MLAPRGRRVPPVDGELEQVLSSALVVGRVARIAAEAGDGVTTLALRLAGAVRSAGDRFAFVDTFHTLAAPDWSPLVGGDGALFVRPPAASRALWAGEVLARCGAFALVLIDVTLADGEPTSSQLGRLRHAAMDGGSSVLVLGGRSTRWRVKPEGLDQASGRHAVRVEDTARSSTSVVGASALSWLAPRRVPLTGQRPDRRPGAARGCIDFDARPGAPP